MQKQTAVEWLSMELQKVMGTDIFYYSIKEQVEQAKQMEKEQIIDAIMYSLDEDGHTGDWKIKFANDYYKKINEGYDIRNKTTTRFFGDTPL